MFSIPPTLQQGNFLLSGYIIATALPSPDETTPSHANLTLPYLGYSSNFSNLSVLKPDIPGGIALPVGSVLQTATYPVLVDASGRLVSPYDMQLADLTANGTRPLLPAYINNNQAGNMPTIYINVQHQAVTTNITLVEADPQTGTVIAGGSEFWVGDFSPPRNSVRSSDPIPVTISTVYFDFESNYFLPIPDGTYVARFVFQRANAAADVALGINPVVPEQWLSPAFVLYIPSVSSSSDANTDYTKGSTFG